MKQAIMEQKGEILFRDIDIPKIMEGQVLIKVKRIGVCGSDIHVWHGIHPYTTFPVVQGHEMSGEIVDMGTKVSSFKKGDKVTIRPQITCGTCYPCSIGDYHICESLKVMGFQDTGAASEYFACDSDLVYKINDSVSFDQIAMIEPISVGIHAISRAGGVKDKNVVVLGAGTIGNLLAQCAKAMGAKKVLITDLSDYRLDLAKKCNIDSVMNTKTDNFKDTLNKEFGTQNADVIFECVGVESTITDAISFSRKGSMIVVVGVFGNIPPVDLGLVQDKELTLVGTLMYKHEDYVKVIELVEQKKLCLEELLTDYIEFSKYSDAYNLIDKRKDQIMKVMITLGE